jgi:hypothetical protein
MGMPSPGDPGFEGWVAHWLSAHVVPLWLARAAVATGMNQLEMARLAWRRSSAEARVLGASRPWVRQSLLDAGIPAADVAEVDRLVVADIERRGKRLADLGTIAERL